MKFNFTPNDIDTNNNCNYAELGSDVNYLENFQNLSNQSQTDNLDNDSSYECKSNSSLVGDITTTYNDSNINTCKTQCLNSSDCVGFDFNQSSNTCVLKKNGSSLTSFNGNTVCLKRKSPKKKNCAYKKKNYQSSLSELNSIFNVPMENNTKPMSNPNMSNPNMSNSNMSNPNMSNPNMLNPLPPNLSSTQIPQESCKPNTVYVDLGCFLGNMKNLEEHTDNMMIDLSLLVSNIKSCSYVKKTDEDRKMKNEQNLLDKIRNNIEIPQPDTVKLVNMPATVIVTTNSKNPKSNNQILGLSAEPFENIEENYPWIYEMLKIILLIFIIWLLIYKK